MTTLASTQSFYLKEFVLATCPFFEKLRTPHRARKAQPVILCIVTNTMHKVPITLEGRLHVNCWVKTEAFWEDMWAPQKFKLLDV
jgi:hypothetical protein